MRVVFLGSKAFGLSVLKASHGVSRKADWRIVHPLDRSDARSCLEYFIDFTRKNDLDLNIACSQSAANEIIRDYRPDVILVCGWYWLINSSILQIPHLGVLGIHNSLLPQYRGGSPLVWSIMNGDMNIGATVFKITEHTDAGPVLAQVKIHLGADETIADALRKIESQLLGIFPEKWSLFLRGEAHLIPQDANSATFCGQRIPDDGRINWREPAWSIHNFVRAQTKPYPGAFSYLDGKKITIWKTIVDSRAYHGVPGQLLSRAHDHAIISCGQLTALKILEVTVDNIPKSARDIFRSVKVRLG